MPSPPPPPLRPRLVRGAWLLIGCAPVLYIAAVWAAYTRNIVFWDEFDTALDLIIRLHDGLSPREILARLFALNNEHRTVTSRLLFAVSYWISGTVNFHVIGAIGNLFQVATWVILVLGIQGTDRRLRLAVVLGFLLFQLEHFESFLWSGASIDHFQVVTLGVAAIVALARQTGRGVAVALTCGMLATFTLAQGNVIWPTGALLLAAQRRWRPLAVWTAGGVLAVLAFTQGFHLNPDHRITGVTAEHAAHILRYWLALLGGPLTLGDAGFGPYAGAVLLAGWGLVLARGAVHREPVAVFTGVFAVSALGLVALGRSELAGIEINSRYLVLGALAWAMLIFILLEFATTPAHPFRWLGWVTPGLVVLLVCAHLKYAPRANDYLEVRERAATRFMQYGEDGRDVVRLHPQERHADILLKMAQERGVYELPSVSHLTRFRDPQPSTRIITHVDELIANDRAVTAGGWAMIRGVRSERGTVYVVLRSPQRTLYFSTVTLQRPDVARAYSEPGWHHAGFRAVIERDRLPAEDFDVGVLIDVRGKPEFTFTANRLLLAGGEPRAERAPPP